MPVVEPTNSASTTPISAKLMALGKAANVHAAAVGILTRHRIWRGDPPKVRQNSSSSRSTLRPPLYVLKNTRKNTTNQDVTPLDIMPSPQNMVIRGTQANLGMELKATI